jgi:excisionase family DNA binding protein
MMTAECEAALRTAVDELVAALLAMVQAEVDSVPAAPDRLLSVDEAAIALGIGRTALYYELTAGRLRSFKVGRRRLIPASAIGAYIAVQAEVDSVEPRPAAGRFQVPMDARRARTGGLESRR